MIKFVLNKDENLVIDETRKMVRKLIRTNSFSNYDMISISLVLYALEKMPIPAENVKVSMKISTKKKKFRDYQSLSLNISNEIVSLNLTNHIEDRHSFNNQSEELYSLILGGQFNTSCSLSKIKKAIKFFTEEYTEIYFYNYNK
jgi:hypothetical protein